MLSEEERTRYSRQIILKEIGVEGQEKLKQKRVLVVGAGGLGSPACFYLTAAGVGTLGIVDFDNIDLSNLQRQILHKTSRLNTPKVDSAEKTLKELNPNVIIEKHDLMINSENIMDLIKGYDVIVEGMDNFPGRFLLNDACVMAKKPLVEAAILGWEGIIMTVKPFEGPCYRCVFPQLPPQSAVPEKPGVVGAVAGTMGVLQAGEVIKILLEVGEGLVGRLLTFDCLTTSFREVKINRNENCPVCGENSTINELKNYELK
ncbi:adenylyltransferase/sulfurtransferase [Desulfitispora alkaliphila]|uniref:HesA/MoeB/ThiF family protein n=1 Tax=Desulfitispora alkaliphila TaxID=622674 RepID=UPI003D199D10